MGTVTMDDAAAEKDRPTILLVDDEEALVWSLANRTAKLRPDYAVKTAGEGQAALRVLESQRIDLLVTDIRMPGMNGLELIMTARRLRPGLPIIIMTAYPALDVRQEAAKSSIEYIEKPFEFERFIALVDDVIQRQQIGFSGAISVQTLPDIVQLYALSSSTGVLRVRHHFEVGTVWFERGAITHAATSSADGEEAFHQIMLWRGGDFSMQLGATTGEHSIHASWTELIMESCRRIDEARRLDDGQSPISKAGWSIVPPPEETEVDVAFAPVGGQHVVVDMIVEGAPDGGAPVEGAGGAGGEEKHMANIKESLQRLEGIDGFIGAAVVDSESGMTLGQEGGGGMNLEVAAASNSEVVRAKRKAIRNLNLKDDVEDILITLGKQYHLIRPLRSRGNLFFYLALDRARANLAMARLTLGDIERDLQV